MRKNRKQQKNGMARQLNLFEDHIKPANSHEGRTGNENCTGVELLSQLENQRTLTENLLEAVVDYGNLRRAYERVRQNKGSAGIDEMDVESLGKWLSKNLPTFRETVLAENFQAGTPQGSLCKALHKAVHYRLCYPISSSTNGIKRWRDVDTASAATPMTVTFTSKVKRQENG